MTPGPSLFRSRNTRSSHKHHQKGGGIELKETGEKQQKQQNQIAMLKQLITLAKQRKDAKLSFINSTGGKTSRDDQKALNELDRSIAKYQATLIKLTGLVDADKENTPQYTYSTPGCTT